MKFRQEKPAPDSSAEESLVRDLRQLDRDVHPEPRRAVPDAYWANLIVRTNRRIDEASSPKALSISWALRVAIPGVVAVLSFVVALHYYAPVHTNRVQEMVAAVQSLPERDIDSVLSVEAASGEVSALAEVGDEVFDVPRDEIADYFIANGKETQLVESMDEQQADKVLDALTHR